MSTYLSGTREGLDPGSDPDTDPGARTGRNELLMKQKQPHSSFSRQEENLELPQKMGKVQTNQMEDGRRDETTKWERHQGAGQAVTGEGGTGREGPSNMHKGRSPK